MQQQTETALEENKKNIPLLVAFCPDTTLNTVPCLPA